MTTKSTVLTVHSIVVPTSQHTAVKRLKRSLSGKGAHGNKVWDAAKLLIDYLHHHPIEDQLSILDVGGGWGVVSAYLAKSSKASVVSLDIDEEVVPYAELLAELNETNFDTVTMAIEDIRSEDLERFDLIVAADICFWDELAETLSELIVNAADAGVPRVIIADPGRPPFYELAEWAQEGYDAELIEWHSSDLGVRGYILDIN